MITLRHLHQGSKKKAALTVKDVIETYDFNGNKRVDEVNENHELYLNNFLGVKQKVLTRIYSNKSNKDLLSKTDVQEQKDGEKVRQLLQKPYFLFVKNQNASCLSNIKCKKASRTKSLKELKRVVSKPEKTASNNQKKNKDSELGYRNIFSEIANIPSTIFSSNCPYCNRKFLSKLVFVSHKLQCRHKNKCKKKTTKTSKLVKTVHCPKCQDRFISVNTLKLHLKFVHRPRPTCLKCDKVFECKRKLLEHETFCAGRSFDGQQCTKQTIGCIDFISSKNVYFCSKCENPFETLQALRLHKFVVNKRNPFDIVFTKEKPVRNNCSVKKLGLQDNLKICVKKNPSINLASTFQFNENKCQTCFKVFQNSKRYENHVIVCQKITSKECFHCGLNFATDAMFLSHRKRCQQKRYNINHSIFFTCTVCFQRFDDPINYDNHLFKLHGIKHCDICNLTYSPNQDLLEAAGKRTKVSQQYNNFIDTCFHCFMQMHTVVNRKIKMEPCDNNNDIKNINLVKKKKETAVGIKSGKVLKNKTIETKVANKISCPRCQIKIKSTKNLTKHLLLCRKWTCSICMRVFDCKSYLHKHKKRFHKLSYCIRCTSFFNVNDGEHLCDSQTNNITGQPKFSFLKKHGEKLHGKCQKCSKICSNDSIHLCNISSERCETLDKKQQKNNAPNLITSNAVLSNNNNNELNKLLNQYGCHLCSEVFKTKIKQALHLITHTPTKTFHCYMCRKTFKLQTGLLRHFLKTHVNASNVQCKLSLSRLMRKHGLQSCCLCKQMFLSKEHLSQHLCQNVTVDLEDINASCKRCNSPLKAPDASNGSLSVSCYACSGNLEVVSSNKTYGESNLKKEVKNSFVHLEVDSIIPMIVEPKHKSDVDIYKCEHCSKQFYRQSKLLSHYKYCLKKICEKEKVVRVKKTNICKSVKQIKSGQGKKDEIKVPKKEVIVDSLNCVSSPKYVRMKLETTNSCNANLEDDRLLKVSTKPKFLDVSRNYPDLRKVKLKNNLKSSEGKKRFWFGDEGKLQKTNLSNHSIEGFISGNKFGIDKYPGDTISLNEKMFQQHQLVNKSMSKSVVSSDSNNFKQAYIEALKVRIGDNLARNGCINGYQQSKYSPKGKVVTGVKDNTLTNKTKDKLFERNAFDFMRDFE